jgi:tRNA1Val (adenine37-N6)-methyltransferase
LNVSGIYEVYAMPVFDELWPQGPRFYSGSGSFRLSTDSVLLAHFTNVKRVRRCADLGGGSGVLSILLAEKNRSASFDAIEIQEESAEIFRKNLAENGLVDRVRVIVDDLRRHRELLEPGSYDLVVSNPPYFTEHSGKTAPVESRAISRDERYCTLNELCAAAAYLCRWGGSFALVHRPERLSEIFCRLTDSGIEPKRLRMVSYKTDSPPSLVLIEGRRGGKPGLIIEPPLILSAPDGTDSDEVKSIYHKRTFMV